MRIRALFIVPSLGRAGAETQVVDLVNNLDPERFEKHLVTFESNLDQLPRVNTQEVTHHYTCRRSKFDLGPARAIAGLIDRLKIDVVHCTLQIALCMGWLGVRLSKRRPPLIVAVHGTENRSWKNEILDRVIHRWLMGTCARVLFVCDTQHDFWITKYPELSRVAVTVHNGVNVSRLDPVEARVEGRRLRERLGISSDALVVAQVAAFRPEKGHAYMVAAAKKLVSEQPSLVVLFAGSGDLKEQVERDVAACGLTRNVRFLGSVADIRPVYGAADVVALPSTTVETFSMAILEALALEVPVVASDVGGARELVIHGKTGLVVPPCDAVALAAGLRAVLMNAPSLRAMGLAGRTLVTDRFTQASMVQKTARVLESVSCADQLFPRMADS
jgi:glycosyltransferase involved in cell wall biosynthesis